MTERGRRQARISGDERQAAILSTAETLLAERGLDEISIEDLARGAGISRSTFYFYFSSKDEVLLALLDLTITELQHRVASLPRDFKAGPVAAWRRALAAFVGVFAEHRAVIGTALTAQPRNADVRELWSSSMQTWADYAAESIRAERARGAAPEGIGATELAIALNLMNERVLATSFGGESPSIAPDAVLDVLVEIWIRSIYGVAANIPTETITRK